MPAYARKEIVRDDEVGIYHCVARCVRRAFLCGEDPVSGRDFGHRKEWIRARLEELAGIFGIEVCGYAVMSNHLHVVVRTRPDVAAGWSKDEVARRWWRLFPRRRDKNGLPAEPRRHELAMLVAEPEAADERRRRLGSLSWFMRCLCEPIARRANKEDECTGRFWEGRFKSQALLDEAAVLACNIYVDLNPVRAAVCETPEQARFTSAHDRIRSRQAKRREARRRGRSGSRQRTRTASERDGWLCPIETKSLSSVGNNTTSRSGSRRGTSKTSRPQLPPERRATHEGFLSMSLDDYLRLMDWTGRQIRSGKRGAIPVHLAPLLERLQVDAGSWTESVRHFGRWFHRAVGRAGHLAEEASRGGKQWLQGLARCRQAFG